MIKMAAKTHTLIVRGVSKEEKNSLKRLARKSPAKLSVNQYMLSVIESHTASERADFKKSKGKIN